MLHRVLNDSEVEVMAEDFFEVRYDKSKGEFSIFANGVSSKTIDAEQVSNELWEWLKINEKWII